jgi:hypothetical protein
MVPTDPADDSSVPVGEVRPVVELLFVPGTGPSIGDEVSACVRGSGGQVSLSVMPPATAEPDRCRVLLDHLRRFATDGSAQFLQILPTGVACLRQPSDFVAHLAHGTADAYVDSIRIDPSDRYVYPHLPEVYRAGSTGCLAFAALARFALGDRRRRVPHAIGSLKTEFRRETLGSYADLGRRFLARRAISTAWRWTRGGPMARHGLPLHVASEYLCVSRSAARAMCRFLYDHPEMVATAMTLPSPARILFPTTLSSIPGIRLAGSALARSRLPGEALPDGERRRARGSGAVFLLTPPDAVQQRMAEPGRPGAVSSTARPAAAVMTSVGSAQ